MQTKEKVVEPTNKAQEFVVEYNKLVKKFGFQIISTPAFKLRDDGTWSVVIQTQVAELPKEEVNEKMD